MSIINRALQKAQREQLMHSRQEMASLLPVQLVRPSRRLWLLLPLGLVAAVALPRVTPAPLPDVVSAPAARPQDVPANTMPAAATPTPLETNRAQALVQRAVAAQEAGDLIRAMSLLEQAMKLDPTAKAAY